MAQETSLLIGAHVSGSGGLWQAYQHSHELQATCMQIFTANQMQWHPKAPDANAIAQFHAAKKEHDQVQVTISHDSYLINLASSEDSIFSQSLKAFAAEIKRCVDLGIDYMNFHPGSHKDQGVEVGVANIVRALDEIRPLYKGTGLKLLLEATAGQGSAIGYRFEELRAILDGVRDNADLGVCIDTCHIFAAGYDIRDAKSLDQTLQEFDRVVGLKRLMALHINDSKKPLGSRVDRHEMLGQGAIGAEAFRLLVNDARTQHLPMVLETPGEMAGFAKEIAWLKSLVGKSKV